jgi:protein-tyrosine kinase
MDEVIERADNFLPRVERRANEAKPNRALVAITAPASAAAEQYRMLHGRLERERAQRPLKVVALTSAVSGEGKSLTAANLALVAAAADLRRRVLLVDADLRRPRLHLLLGVGGRPGLGELLGQEATAAQVIRRPSGSRLAVVPAGACRDEAGARIEAGAMRRFLEEAQAHFDEIYLDAPPVLPVADGALLASMSDAAILVVRAGVTAKSLVWQAVESMAGARILGCVLNGVHSSEVPYLAQGRGR